jgi:hypothetical protein
MRQLCIVMLLLPFMALAQTFEKGILTMTEITAKQGHSTQFKDGVKKWTECMKENGTTGNWNFWTRIQGEGSVYGITGMMDNWAEMDDESDDPAGAKCYSIASNFIIPHVEKINRAMANTLPDWSKRTMATDTKLVWVSYFRVKNGSLFSEVVKDVTSTLAKEEGEPRGQWYGIMGGAEDEADYMVVTSHPNYADLDKDEDGPFVIYEKVHGEKKANAMREKWRSAVDSGWSYMWELNAELSN